MKSPGSMRSLSRVFKAVSDETRLTIMALIFRHGHLCVCEVEQILGITQSKASRHLRYLRDAGLLEDRRDGLIVNYHLPEEPDPDRRSILEFLEKLLADRPLPQAGPLLVQIRDARLRGDPASSVEARVQ
jgi:ArsR family transcriptional regulator, arsenate/arsenite/antimonite-responsive transcriptional repressor